MKIDNIKLYILIGISIILCSGGIILMGNNAAQEALNQGQNYLNNHYDYNSAITWFTRASELYEPITDPTQQQSKAQAWLGLAMAYHHIGQHVLRDQYLAKAQVLLQIPDDLAVYTDANKFTAAAIDYCVVHGYRLYIYYEQCQKAAGAIDQQKAHFLLCKDSYHKPFLATTLENFW